MDNEKCICPIIVHCDLHYELMQVFNLLCILDIFSVLFVLGHPVFSCSYRVQILLYTKVFSSSHILFQNALQSNRFAVILDFTAFSKDIFAHAIISHFVEKTILKYKMVASSGRQKSHLVLFYSYIYIFNWSLWYVYSVPLICLLCASDMFTLCLWYVYSVPLICLLCASDMFTLCLWYVYSVPLICLLCANHRR